MFRKTAMTRKNFQNRVEGFLISAMGWHCMAEVAAANGYPDHIQHWRGEVERIIFIDLSFFITNVTIKPKFDRRRAINEILQTTTHLILFKLAIDGQEKSSSAVPEAPPCQ